jgi:hypothetical protein
VWALAGLILGILRILASSPPITKGLRPLGGITAVAGFPLAALYVAHGGLFLVLQLEVAVSFRLALFCRGWPRSMALCLTLLVLHFGLWSWGISLLGLAGLGTVLARLGLGLAIR